MLSACAGGAWTAPANGNPANEKSLDVVHVQASNFGSSTWAILRTGTLILAGQYCKALTAAGGAG